MQEVTQMVHLFFESMAMLKNKLLPTILALLLQYLILLFRRVFTLIFPKNQDSRSYSSCQVKFQKIIFLRIEILYTENNVMLFMNRTRKGI